MEIILAEGARIPERAHEGDLGFDLFSNEMVTLGRGQKKLISTGVRIKFPKGFGGIIKDRSSIASKHGIFTHAGVIDEGYRGEIKILMHNTSGKYYQIRAGDKIAQLILIAVRPVYPKQVDEFTDETSRSDDGFGSTGG